jgi:2-amino-4-hydroxy-6-hydroxymethyldihydropteridine diphosphokinase
VQVNKCNQSEKHALVAFGANLPVGDASPADTVAAAMDMLDARVGGVARKSRLWRTPAFPEGAGPPFVNAAMSFAWSGTAQDLLAVLHDIERSFGRKRTGRWEARKMDLDLIGLGDRILPGIDGFREWFDLSPEDAARLTPAELVLPHPRLTERGFVLVPLSEVAADWRHPVLGQTVRTILDNLPSAALSGIEPLDGPED